MVLLIDNYDSFSYNLYQLIGSMESQVTVVRNDDEILGNIEQLHPSHIIISPGPGKPKDAGKCEEIIAHLKGKIPILGVCLGHQAICETFGATISYAKERMHGKMSIVHLEEKCKLFRGLVKKTEVGRYHSLIALRDTIPECLQITAETEDGEVMGVKHKDYEIYGLQFHPESILTPKGKEMIENFLNYCS